MKKLFYLFILFVFSAQAQLHKMPADTEFLYSYGGTNFDEARDIKETPDKGYIVVGTTSSFGQGNTSVYMIKTDALGKHVWSSVQGGVENDWAYSVELTPDSGIFVAGYSNSFNAIGHNYSSPYYFKTDKKGNLIWQKAVDVGSWCFIYGSCALSDSGYILCGQTYYATPDGSSDAYLMRLNKNGDTLWTNHYGDIQDEIFNSVCVINNKIYAVGGNATHPADTASDGWIVKLDMNGHKLQETFISFGGHIAEKLNGITPYNNTQFTVCGSVYYPDSNATLGVITKFDTSLTNMYLNKIGFTTKNYLMAFNKVINISHGNACIIGYAIGGYGGTNMFFIGFDANGNAINNYDYLRHSGGQLNDYGYSGILSTSGKLIGVGSTQGFSGMSANYCTNPKLGLEDFFLVRFDSDSISGAVLAQQSSNLPITYCFADTLFLWQADIKNYTHNFTVKLFPNPISSYAQLQITSEQQNNYTVRVYSILGNEVMSDKISSTNSKTLDFSNLSEGSYFLKIQDENGQNASILKFIISR